MLDDHRVCGLFARARAAVPCIGSEDIMTTFSTPRNRVVIGRVGPRGRQETPGQSNLTPDATSDGPSGGLGEMLDRASGQLAIIRRTLEHADALERATRQRAGELDQRIDTARRLNTEIDQRLAAAGRANGVLEQATTALVGLEALVTRMHSMHAGFEQRFAERLAAAQGDLETRLAGAIETSQRKVMERAEVLERSLYVQSEACEERVRTLAESYEKRIGELTARINNTIGHAEDAHARLDGEVEAAWSGIERDLNAHAESLHARLDRETAATHARVSLLLDSASDRVAIMESQAQHIEVKIGARVDELCTRAARILGCDPSAETSTSPSAGSLLKAVVDAQAVLADCDDASMRITIAARKADEAAGRAEVATELARAVAHERQGDLSQIGETVRAGEARVREFEETLADAVRRHDETASKMEHAQRQMASLREDLETIATAARYHVDQVRDAQRQADLSAETARVRAASLERAMEDVTRQAESLVGMARDVGTLLAKVQEARDGLAGGAGGPSIVAA